MFKDQMEISRLKFENEGFARFISGEHENLILEDKEVGQKAREIKEAGRRIDGGNVVREKMEELEELFENLKVYKYTQPKAIHMFEDSNEDIGGVGCENDLVINN